MYYVYYHSSLLLSLLIGKNLLEARKPSFHVAVWPTELATLSIEPVRKDGLHWEGQGGWEMSVTEKRRRVTVLEEDITNQTAVR